LEDFFEREIKNENQFQLREGRNVCHAPPREIGGGNFTNPGKRGKGPTGNCLQLCSHLHAGGGCGGGEVHPPGVGGGVASEGFDLRSSDRDQTTDDRKSNDRACHQLLRRGKEGVIPS
jgi:hypothetical protein